MYVKIASQWTYLISGMTSVSVYHGRITPSHGVNKPTDKCLRRVLPFLMQRGLEFVDVRRLSSSVVDTSPQLVPKVLYGSEIGGEGWPVQYMNCIGLKNVLSKKSTLSLRIILLEKITRMLSEKWNHMRPNPLD